MKFETRDEGKGKSLRCQTTFANEKFILIAAGDIFSMILFFFANKGKKNYIEQKSDINDIIAKIGSVWQKKLNLESKVNSIMPCSHELYERFRADL